MVIRIDCCAICKRLVELERALYFPFSPSGEIICMNCWLADGFERLAEARHKAPCESDSVSNIFYGDGVRFAAGWWGKCGECGRIVAVRSDGTNEWPDVHEQP